MDPNALLGIRLSLLVLALGGVVFEHHCSRRGDVRRPLWFRIAAVCAVALALGSYAQFGEFVRGHFLNYHDLFHYYFGSKYAPEVGYHRLYHCALIALDEHDPKWHSNVRSVRSMKTYRHFSKRFYLQQPEVCTGHFSSERWAEFKRDIAQYHDHMRRSFKGRLGDKGYNASPVWTLVGGIFSRNVPLQPYWQVNLLGMLDLALLVAALLLAWRAFGWWSVVLGILFLGGCFELSRPHIRGGFLRLDWLACLLASFSLVRLRWNRTAGALLGYAVMVRMFPVLFLFGLMVRAIAATVRERTVPRRYVEFFGAFAFACVLLLSLTWLEKKDLSAWRDFATKIQLHDSDISPLRVGLKYALIYRGETSFRDYVGLDGRWGYRPHFVNAKRSIYESLLWFRAAFALALMAGLAYLLRQRQDAEAMALSFPLVFALVNPTFYYYCFFFAVVVGLADYGRRTFPGALILAGILSANIAVHIIVATVSFPLLAHFLYSVLMGLLGFYTLGVLWAFTPSRETS